MAVSCEKELYMCVFVVYNMMSDDNSGFTQVNCVPVVLRDFVHVFSNLCRHFSICGGHQER